MANVDILYKMTIKLRDDITNIIKNNYITSDMTYAHIEMYDSILISLKRTYRKSTIVRRLPQIEELNDPDDINEPKTIFVELLSATGQVLSFIEGVLDDPDKKLDELNNEIKSLKEKNSELEKVNILNSESLNKYIKADEFPISNEILSKVSEKLVPTLQDALSAYGAGSYTACVCVCRNIIQGLVQEQCDKEDIKENGLKKQIAALTSKKKIEQEHNRTILATVTTLGNRSAHPTTEVFTKEKASLVLNGLLILIDEVFT